MFTIALRRRLAKGKVTMAGGTAKVKIIIQKARVAVSLEAQAKGIKQNRSKIKPIAIV